MGASSITRGACPECERRIAPAPGRTRPKARSLSLELVLSRAVEHPRVARTIGISGSRTVHIVKLVTVDDVDDLLRDWLTGRSLPRGPRRRARAACKTDDDGHPGRQSKGASDG
jgi:hypothetical protein